MGHAKLPEAITREWVVGLSDDELINAEARLFKALDVIERREKKRWGARYELLRGPSDLLAAWDRWTRVNQATRERGLRARRVNAA